MTEFELAAAARLMGAYAFWILSMFAVVMWRAAANRRRLTVSASMVPRVRDALVEYLAGSDNMEPLRRFNRTSRRDVGAAIMGFQGMVSGVARDRLCDLTIELTLVHDWAGEARSRDLVRRREAYTRLAFVTSYEPCRRIVGEMLLGALENPDQEVRLAAARAVLQAGVPAEIDEVFWRTMSQNMLVRVLLAEDLRRHAATLCERAIPDGIQSDDPARVMAILDMLLAWERALPLTGLARLMEQEDRAIRLRAVRLAPLVSPDRETEAEVVRALADADPELCRIAARAAGRMRLDQALPLLARCVRQGTPEVAREAAFAMAEMPPVGVQTLEELSTSSNPSTAAAASEALARVRPQAGSQ